MDANQLNELATNARLNHWPPHLGVVTDAEKMEYLANALDEVTLRDAQIEALENEIKALEKETSDLEDELDAHSDKIDALETKVEDLTVENEQLRDELAIKTEGPNV